MEPKALLHGVYTSSHEVVARKIAGDLFIVPLPSGIGDVEDELHTLNDTGVAIWERLDGNRSLQEIAEVLASEYDAPSDEIERC